MGRPPKEPARQEAARPKSAWTPNWGRNPLTQWELEMLRRGGIDADADRGNVFDPRDPVREGLAELAEMVRTALYPEEVSHAYDFSRSEVEDLVARRVIYSFHVARLALVPTFQFWKGRLYPGADAVFPRLPPDLHPVEVVSWFFHPTPDLRLEDCGRDLSPEEWLRFGMDPSAIGAMARSLV